MPHSHSNTSLLLNCDQAKSKTHMEQLAEFLSTRPDLPQPNTPDFHQLNTEEESFTIENARTLTAEMAMRPYQSAQSLFVIFNIETASLPAQNALLKNLEEPPEHVQILLTTTQAGGVLQTIRSRCTLVDLRSKMPAEAHTDISAEFETIKKSSHGQLILLSEKYKERDVAIQFTENLITFLHSKNTTTPSLNTTKILQKSLESLELLKQNVNVRLVMEDLFFAIA